MSLYEPLRHLSRYLGNILVFSIFLDYERNPVWNDWRWKVIIPFSFINIILILYNMYKNGIDFSIISNLVWLFVYVMILRFYMLKFPDKDTIKKNIDNDPLKSGKWFKWLAGIGLTLSIVCAILTVLQFVPLFRPFVMPILAILGNFI